MGRFKCALCDRIVVSVHLHKITQLNKDEFSRVYGRSVKTGQKVCCRHFEAHTNARFTAKKRVAIRSEFDANLDVPAVRIGRRSINRPPPILATSVKQKLRDAEAELTKLRTEIVELKNQLEDQSRSFLQSCIALVHEGVGPALKDAEAASFWFGTSSLDWLVEYSRPTQQDSRGRKKFLNEKECLAMTLMFLRKGFSFAELSKLGCLSETRSRTNVEECLETLYVCVKTCFIVQFTF